MQEKKYLQVGVSAPIDESLTYINNDPSLDLQIGASVEVPLGRRKVKGVIVDSLEKYESNFKLKSISSVNTERPLLSKKFMSWCQWVSNYYFYPLGMVLDLAFPPLKKNSQRKTKHQVIPDIETSYQPDLTDEQQNVIKNIKDQKGFATHLLHGVTGSGKTEVYLSLISDCLDRGQSALILVPEISLTPQLLKRFAARFPDQVAIIHSQLTAREKTNQWWSAFSKEKKILIGARSALFCPIDDVGIIIIDEEHEPSFKQEEKLKYHARDSAIVLGKYHNCPIILGSATPSLESFQQAQAGKYFYHQMTQRVHKQAMPEAQVIDLKQERSGRTSETSNDSELPFWLSRTLYDHIDDCLSKKKQTALFLNRRGIAQLVICPDCSFVYECPNCEISLTLHKQKDLTCHYCDYSAVLADHCPGCNSIEIKPMGLGTEKVENDIKKLFPEARVARVDRDEVSNRHQLEDIIERMENLTIDIMVGTQMIAKGLDFPNLHCVGLILADIGFNLPNFRSHERSFQLITQVSGRAGRNPNDPGHVIIQAYNTEHPSITYAIQNDFNGFAKEELAMRNSLSFPPYSRLALIKFSSSKLDLLEQCVGNLKNFSQKVIGESVNLDGVRALGPSQAPLFKLKNIYRYHMLVLAPTHQKLHHFCKCMLQNKKAIFGNQVKVLVDIDPVNML